MAGQNAHVHFVILSAGKAFTEPLLLVLTVALVATIAGLVRSPPGDPHRKMSVLALASLLALWILATPAIADLLNRAIRLDAREARAPAIIIVPSGGSFYAGDGRSAVLSSSTAGRLVEGIWWQRHNPQALLVLTGGDTTTDGTSGRTVEAMREEAIRRGVPAASIRTEVRSRNTREHAIELAKVISPETPIGIVTSDWHLRRTETEFARYFHSIAIRSWEPPQRQPLTIGDFLPSSWGLRWSTLMLQEWIGLAWYALRS